jgi:hypothetical protein
MSLAALATGLIQALGTEWGLFQHKPWGRTRYGRRLLQPARFPLSLGLKVSLAILGVIVVAVVVLHLTGHGLGNHGH